MSITGLLIVLAAKAVIISVSTFKPAVILYSYFSYGRFILLNILNSRNKPFTTGSKRPWKALNLLWTF